MKKKGISKHNIMRFPLKTCMIDSQRHPVNLFLSNKWGRYCRFYNLKHVELIPSLWCSVIHKPHKLLKTIEINNFLRMKECFLIHSWSDKGLTLSLLGYLKTRICWGGGSFWPPPSKSRVWCPNMTNDTSLESSCALLLESKK